MRANHQFVEEQKILTSVQRALIPKQEQAKKLKTERPQKKKHAVCM